MERELHVQVENVEQLVKQAETSCSQKHKADSQEQKYSETMLR